MTVWAIAVLLGGNSHPGRRPPAVTFARGCAFGIGGGRPPPDTALSAIGRGPSVEFLTPYRRPTVATGVSHQPCPVNGRILLAKSPQGDKSRRYSALWLSLSG